MQLRHAFKSVLYVVISALTVLSFLGTAAHAVTISPVLVELSPARRVVSITILNPGDIAVSFQTQTLAWHQSDGVDRYDETDEIVVIPPIAEIAAGGSQIFRVMMRKAPTGAETAYRLIFEDVTEFATRPMAADQVSINIRVNHNLPVFIAVAGKPRANPRLGPCTSSVAAKPAMTGCVRIDNDGSRYAQIKSIAVDGAGWHKDLAASSRVLAGAWRQWTFDVPPQLTGTLQVKAETSEGPMTFEWPIPAR